MKKKTWIRILFFIVCIFAAAPSAHAEEKHRALVVTRGDYGDPENNLSPGPENDGKNFLRILEQSCGDSLSATHLEKQGAESAAELKAAVSETFSDSDEDDVNYFFYSGHGGEAGMWLDGWEFFSASDLADAFAGISGTNFMVIDCCYSGNLIMRTQAEDFAQRFIREFESSLDRLRARSALTTNQFHVITASSADELSWQGSLGSRNEQMGFFTSALAAGCGVNFRNISRNEDYQSAAMADEDRNGVITVQEVYEYVAQSMWTSRAAVYPENDTTPFLTVSDDQIPSAVVADAVICLDEEEKPYLDLAYEAGQDSIFEGALYQCASEDVQNNALIMSTASGIGSYAYADLLQRGSWYVSADDSSAKVRLPLEGKDLSPGDYLLLVREKDGNTGCYLYMLTLESTAKAEDELSASAVLLVNDSFSIEEEGSLEIQVDFGSSSYANYSDYDISCRILDGRGRQVSFLGTQKADLSVEQGICTQSCSFFWNGQNNNRQQVSAGTYTIEATLSRNGITKRLKKEVEVKSDAPPNEEDQPYISDLAAFQVSLSATQFVYDGTAKQPKVIIAGLAQGRDYTLSYANNKNAGRAEVSVSGAGFYTGKVVKYFTIHPANAASAKISVPQSMVYTGKKQTPKTQVSFMKRTLAANTDYRVSYSNNKKIGLGKVSVTGIGNYTGSCTKTFRILPPKCKIRSVRKSGGDSMTVRWKKAAAADGYELQYSTGKSFKKKISRKSIQGRTRQSCTLYNLKKQKKYYFRIRSYKVVKGDKWYSPFE